MKAKTLPYGKIRESRIRPTNHKSPRTSLIGKASQCKEVHLETDVLKKWLALDLSRLTCNAHVFILWSKLQPQEAPSLFNDQTRPDDTLFSLPSESRVCEAGNVMKFSYVFFLVLGKICPRGPWSVRDDHRKIAYFLLLGAKPIFKITRTVQIYHNTITF